MSAKPPVAAGLRATRRRADTADHFRLMAEFAPVMIWLADPRGGSVYFNRRWLEFRGRRLEEELGTGWLDGVHPEDRRACVAAQSAALAGREPLEIEFRLQRREGEYRLVRVNGAPILDGDQVAGFVGSCLDITDEEARRAGELERERIARASAEAATLARDQFLAIVSHELRSPLNGIKSWTHVLENQVHGSGDPTIVRAIAGIMIGVEQQVRLIDDLLDVTRALSGNLGLAKGAMALAPAIVEAVEALRAVASEKGVHLVVDPALVDASIHGDPVRVHQIVSNLVGNAIKFTPAGGTVQVGACIAGDMARIEVRDNGAGIPGEFLPFVFDPFRQAEQAAATHRHQQGLGLGLALVHRLAELHGGRVTCESEGPGRGATFRVYLPLRVDDPASSVSAIGPGNAPAAATLPSLAGLKVMVVDDQREHRESLAALLEQAGACVVLAASGQEALNRLEGQPGEGETDVIVCDIAMPTDDGYATLHRIRDWEAQNGRSRRPAIAVSAFSERQDRIRALSEGFQMHLAKPVAPAELVLVVASLARGMQRV